MGTNRRLAHSFFTFASLVSLLYTPYAGVSASDAVLGNTNTGPDSSNSNNVSQTASTSSSVTNTSTTSNTINFNLNTGRNTVRNNTTVGGIQTGTIAANVATNTQANVGSGITNIPTADQLNVVSTNSTTGPGSENRNTTSLSSTNTTTIRNTSSVNNSVNLVANTGDNRIERNTQAGAIKTGDIRINVALNTRANVSVPNTPPTGGGGTGGGPGVRPSGGSGNQSSTTRNNVPVGGAQVAMAKAVKSQPSTPSFFAAGSTGVPYQSIIILSLTTLALWTISSQKRSYN